MAEEKTVRKKTAKKTTRKTTTKDVRKNATKKTATKISRVPQSRRAPTDLASRNETAKNNSMVFYSGLGFVLMLLIASVVIGVMGEDEIVVSNAIDAQRESATPEELEKINSIPVQGTKKRLPNGGLTPTPNNGAPKAQQAEPVTASDEPAASSTSPTSTTTQESISDEGSDVVADEEALPGETTSETGVTSTGATE